MRVVYNRAIFQNMYTEFTIDQYETGYPDGIEDHWWHLARNRLLASIISKMCGPDSKILDVGCGRGILVKYLRDIGVDCKGVDISEPDPIDKVGNHIFTGIDVLDLPLKERERYDTVLFLDVVEHTTDSVSFLKNILGSLPNVKTLIITVPARQELWSNQDEYYGHYRRYTLDMLGELGKAINARSVLKSYFFHSLYPLLWILLKLIKNRNPKVSKPRPGWKLFHQLISHIMFLDYYIIPKRYYGTSALAVYLVNNR